MGDLWAEEDALSWMLKFQRKKGMKVNFYYMRSYFLNQMSIFKRSLVQ